MPLDWNGLFDMDALSIIVSSVVASIAAIIFGFSRRYMRGDSHVNRFNAFFGLTVLSVLAMVNAAHLAAFVLFWALGNFALVQLMIHKRSWQAARNAGLLAAMNLAAGVVTLAGASYLMYTDAQSAHITTILAYYITNPVPPSVPLLLIITAFTQSAIWPFHRWLLSSLNSPTPVSAFMHAGLINAGGFLLARFAPLFLYHNYFLTALFVFGVITAVLGTLYKLVQTDIKRMLASSTMAQMGFMIMQAGLGLFAAGIAHYCYHGLFKAYLFLVSGSAAQSKSIKRHLPTSPIALGVALVAGLAGSYGFSFMSKRLWGTCDTSLILVIFAGVGAAQLSLAILSQCSTALTFVAAIIVPAFAGATYGYTVFLIENYLSGLGLMQPQPLNAIHMAGTALLLAGWLFMLFRRYKCGWFGAAYVRLLNNSQPNPCTITTTRNGYNFQ